MSRCYFNAYEPHRLLHSFRLAAAASAMTAPRPWLAGAASFRTAMRRAWQRRATRRRGCKDAASRRGRLGASARPLAPPSLRPVAAPFLSPRQASHECHRSAAGAWGAADGLRHGVRPHRVRGHLHLQESAIEHCCIDKRAKWPVPASRSGGSIRRKRSLPAASLLTSTPTLANARRQPRRRHRQPGPLWRRGPRRRHHHPIWRGRPRCRPLPAASRGVRGGHHTRRLVSSRSSSGPGGRVVCCILLNQTSRVQVDSVLSPAGGVFDAAALASADAESVESILRPLGLHRRRARTLIRFSSSSSRARGARPRSCQASASTPDAHAIFCEAGGASVSRVITPCGGTSIG